MRYLDKLIGRLAGARIQVRLRRVQAMPNSPERDSAWEALLQDLSPGETIVWARQFPAVLKHECPQMRAVIDSLAAGDGLPESYLGAMTHCYWCGAELPGRFPPAGSKVRP
jgi:hypothetical protein